MASGPVPTVPGLSGDLRNALHARQRGRELVALHRDAARPERPVFSIVLWGLAALATFVAAVYVAYATWYQERLDSSTGLVLVVGVLTVHAIAVFSFSYAYEIYDARKALKMALVVLAAAVSVIVVLIGIFVVLAALRDGDAGDIGDALGGVAKGITNLGMGSDDAATAAGNAIGSFLEGQGPAVAAGFATCPHTSLFPRWDSVQDMGKPERVTAYLCTGCDAKLSREEGERLQASRFGSAV